MATANVKIPGYERKLSLRDLKKEVRYALNSFLFRFDKKEPPLTALVKVRTEIGTHNASRKAILDVFNKAVEDVERKIKEGAEAISIRTLLQERIRVLY
jgi:hypothetical protein